MSLSTKLLFPQSVSSAIPGAPQVSALRAPLWQFNADVSIATKPPERPTAILESAAKLLETTAPGGEKPEVMHRIEDRPAKRSGNRPTLWGRVSPYELAALINQLGYADTLVQQSPGGFILRIPSLDAAVAISTDKTVITASTMRARETIRSALVGVLRRL